MKHIPLILLLLIVTSYRPFGDVNGDYRVNIMDLYIIDKITLGMEHTPFQRIRADLNRDGKVDELDMNILHNYVLNLP